MNKIGNAVMRLFITQVTTVVTQLTHCNCAYAIFLKELSYRLLVWLSSIALDCEHSSGERESSDKSRGGTTQSSRGQIWSLSLSLSLSAES
ncbi:MAG: hypothetical protein J07HQW2_03508 [Haloquadratum walsbyi J07HQW2]|uniref:Uncharacterized protein n=1 Tax=Haloquadratum walsbyi J07HQW2 TaxID=1238425 RepID=U1PT99_9EURY|nr:MAG: hypothetical protein J07HQW2_03508 [Haloquadratum walsbyi J07HQW2]